MQALFKDIGTVSAPARGGRPEGLPVGMTGAARAVNFPGQVILTSSNGKKIPYEAVGLPGGRAQVAAFPGLGRETFGPQTKACRAARGDSTTPVGPAGCKPETRSDGAQARLFSRPKAARKNDKPAAIRQYIGKGIPGSGTRQGKSS